MYHKVVCPWEPSRSRAKQSEWKVAETEKRATSATPQTATTRKVVCERTIDATVTTPTEALVSLVLVLQALPSESASACESSSRLTTFASLGTLSSLAPLGSFGSLGTVAVGYHAKQRNAQRANVVGSRKHYIHSIQTLRYISFFTSQSPVFEI